MIEISRRQKQYLNDLQVKKKIKVLFVCLGNICRSPAAQGVFEDIVKQNDATERFEIDSAGTGNYHIGDLPDNRMRIHARRRGYELTHRARQFRFSDFDEFDLIIPMDDSNKRNILNMAREEKDELKVMPMAYFLNDSNRYDYVPDPYYEGSEGFELVLDLLEEGALNLYQTLRNK